MAQSADTILSVNVETVRRAVMAHLVQPEELDDASRRSKAARALIDLLNPLVEPPYMNREGKHDGQVAHNDSHLVAAIRDLLPDLLHHRPLFTTFHDGQEHHPLGGGAYAFRNDIVGPLLLALVNDETVTMSNGARPAAASNPSRPIVIHIGAQPNNSPHAGTLVVFSLAFLLARALHSRMRGVAAVDGNAGIPLVSVEVTFVDTAPVSNETCEIDGLRYQHTYRENPAALALHMHEYEEVLGRMSEWSGIPFRSSLQSDFFSQPAVPALLSYIVSHRDRLALQLAPRHNALALRAACPVPGCGLVEKHGLLNRYTDGGITFNCPRHGEHSVSFTEPSEVVRLAANTPMRNLIRSMAHIVDEAAHHIRITGADYAGTYQEACLYRPLAEWSGRTGCRSIRTPHIIYAPLIVDWSGAKLSKSFYIRDGGYSSMEFLGLDGLCSYQSLKTKYGHEGLRLIWDEVERWIKYPHMLFRASYSVEYFRRVLNKETPAGR